MLHGREREWSVIDRLLAGTKAGRGGALVLRGEAGVGKSTLLDHAAAHAGDLTVLRATGVEAESGLAFAAVHQLLAPVLSCLDRLPDMQADALRGALRLGPPRADDPFLVSLALLTLLTEAADQLGLLCLIDDAHWLDPASADALVFCARRLATERVVILFGTRAGTNHEFAAPGLAELTLTGLDAMAAGELVAQTAAGPTAESVRGALFRGTGGNPLALVELMGLLSADQLSGREPLPEPLPISAGMEQAFLAQVRTLPADSQLLLLVAAAEDTGNLRVVLAAARRLDLDARAFEAAEQQGLLTLSTSRLAFRHPLVRAAVYGAAGFSQRRRVHETLAATLAGEHEADRRVWHLSLATFGPDEAVAAELESSAERARQRGGYASAATVLERAAELTPEPVTKARRLAAAADATWRSGEPERAFGLLSRADALTGDARTRAEAGYLRGLFQQHGGVVTDAYTTLMEAAAPIVETHPGLAVRILAQAMEAASYAGDMPGTVAAGRAAARLPGDEAEVVFFRDAASGIAEMTDGNVEGARASLRRALAAPLDLADPARGIVAGVAASYLGEVATALDLFTRTAERARGQGAVGVLPHYLEFQAMAALARGQLASAEVIADEGLRLARETGQEVSACMHLGHLAMVAAVRGREEECRAFAAEALSIGLPRRLALPVSVANLALARLDLVAGPPAQALERITSSAAGGTGVSHPLMYLYASPDWIEAAARAGDTETAAAVLARFEAWAAQADSGMVAAMLARCRGVLADDGNAPRYFEEALALLRTSPSPLDQARTELLYGETLRRSRRPSRARGYLRAALDGFERMDAGPWAERARSELRAAGESAPARAVAPRQELTPQETRIAELVAGGASNREVAARLFLSPRTVEYHLYKIFPKLGISSRTELIRLGAGAKDRGLAPSTG